MTGRHGDKQANMNLEAALPYLLAECVKVAKGWLSKQIRDAVREELGRDANSRPEAAAEQEFLVTSAAAKITGVSPGTIRDWIKAGRLPAEKAAGSGRYRIRRSDLVARLGEADPTAIREEIDFREHAAKILFRPRPNDSRMA